MLNTVMLFTVFCFILISGVISRNIIQNFYPHHPVGPYIVYLREIIQCNPMESPIAKHNLYLNKISHNVSEIRGNITVMRPFDDSYDFSYRMDIKDSTGGWRENAFIYKGHNGCTVNKRLLGGSLPLVKKNSTYNGNCPVLPGEYIVQGLDMTSEVINWNIPKQFFYGIYKYQHKLFDNKNNQVSCHGGIIQLKRPWEIE